MQAYTYDSFMRLLAYNNVYSLRHTLPVNSRLISRSSMRLFPLSRFNLYSPDAVSISEKRERSFSLGMTKLSKVM